MEQKDRKIQPVENKKTRSFDDEAKQTVNWWKKSFVYIAKKEIRIWKAMLVIAFIAGIASATVMIVTLERESSLQASLAPAKISFSPASVNAIEGETFSVDLLLDTANGNVVVSNAIVMYDTAYLQLTGWNTDNSVFESGNECAGISMPCEIVEDDQASGRLAIALAKPSPGVNTESGKLATLSFKALQVVSSSSVISLDFNVQGDYEDSDVILDDGDGTDTLSSVGILALNVRATDEEELLVLNGLPSGELPSGTSSVAISIETGMAATCKYSASAGNTYETMQQEFGSTGGISHSETISGLSDGDNLLYHVRCEDLEGVRNSNEYLISFYIGESMIDEIADSGPVVAPPSTEDANAQVVSETVGGGGGTISVPNPEVSYDGEESKISGYFKKDRKIKFSAQAASVKGGKVQVLVEDKVKKEAPIDNDGNWRIKMGFKETAEIKIRYLDDQGREVSSKKYKIKIDNEKPEFTDLPSVLKMRPGDKLWWNASDNKGIDRYKYKGFGLSKETKKEYFYLPYQIGKGPHNVEITAYDKAGNKARKKVLVWVW